MSVKQSVSLSLDNTKELTLIAKALSVEVRIDIIKLLLQQDLNINEISEILKIPASSAAAHIKVLEESGIITTKYKAGIRGSMKVSHLAVGDIWVNLQMEAKEKENIVEIDMPIGNYVDYRVEPTCGLVNEKGPIDDEDEPRCFYNPNRYTAQLLWIGAGFVEYRFPNNELRQRACKRLELSIELCSEDHDYNLEYPSDITVWINGMEVGTWACPSDYGGRRGKLNPSWWPDKNTQYGELKTWSIDRDGCYLDGELVRLQGIESYQLPENEFISVRIGIKEEATNPGGFNLFGECFGDYPQNIRMKLIF